MEELASVINNFARLILYAGGGVFTIAVCVAGFFYMTAFGDPQKQNIARGALVGAFVGICIMGVSFLAPRVMSQLVLEPAGLEGVAETAGTTGCDRTLRSALVTQQGLGGATQVNAAIRIIQAQRSRDRNREVWNPFVHVPGIPPGADATSDVSSSGFKDGCGARGAPQPTSVTVGQTDVPSAFLAVAVARVQNATYGGFARDAAGNIMVEFAPKYTPTDGSQCWLHIARANYWDQQA